MASLAPFPLVPRHDNVVAFVWRCWRGITARDVLIVLLLGLVIGLLQGTGVMLSTRLPTTWRTFASPIIDVMRQALCLLLCLAVARNVTPKRLPGWAPYALAALAGFALDTHISILWQLLVEHFDDAKQWPGLTGDLAVMAWINLPAQLLLFFLGSFGYMYAIDSRRRADTLRGLQLDGTRLARQSYESRLQAMQARIEPQFLFETLRDAARVYENDTQAGERILDDLIVYLRGVLPRTGDAGSTAAMEIDIARAWLDIMVVRGGRPLAVSVAATAEARAAQVPPMILPPLVASAFAAAMRSPTQHPWLTLAAARDADRLHLSISDSGGAFRAAEWDSADVVDEVRKRLWTLYGNAASLSLESRDDGGSHALVDLPYALDE